MFLRESKFRIIYCKTTNITSLVNPEKQVGHIEASILSIKLGYPGLPRNSKGESILTLIRVFRGYFQAWTPDNMCWV